MGDTSSGNGSGSGGGWLSDHESRLQRVEAEQVLLRRDLTNETGWRRGLDEVITGIFQRVNDAAASLLELQNQFEMLRGALMGPEEKKPARRVSRKRK